MRVCEQAEASDDYSILITSQKKNEYRICRIVYLEHWSWQPLGPLLKVKLLVGYI